MMMMMNDDDEKKMFRKIPLNFAHDQFEKKNAVFSEICEKLFYAENITSTF